MTGSRDRVVNRLWVSDYKIEMVARDGFIDVVKYLFGITADWLGES